jgi:hypothetical protein
MPELPTGDAHDLLRLCRMDVAILVRVILGLLAPAGDLGERVLKLEAWPRAVADRTRLQIVARIEADRARARERRQRGGFER